MNSENIQNDLQNHKIQFERRKEEGAIPDTLDVFFSKAFRIKFTRLLSAITIALPGVLGVAASLQAATYWQWEDWRWYDNNAVEPVNGANDLAAENTSLPDVDPGDSTSIYRLRFTCYVTGGASAPASAENYFQFSTDSEFGGTPTALTSTSSPWRLADGAATEGNTVTSLLLSGSENEGTYFEKLTDDTAQLVAPNQNEFDIAIQCDGTAECGTTYYFRASVIANKETMEPPDSLYPGATYASLTTRPATPTPTPTITSTPTETPAETPPPTFTQTPIPTFIPMPIPWPMFHRDAQRTGKSPMHGPVSPVLEWSYCAGSLITSSPAVGASGAINFGSENNTFHSIASDGALLWSYAAGRPILSAPAVSSNAIWIGSDDKRLYCMTVTGMLSWSYATDDKLSSSPAISGMNTVYVGSEDNRLYSVSSVGSLLWSYETSEAILSSPAISADKVYVGSDDHRFYCIDDASGSLSWSYETENDVLSSPSVNSAGFIHFGSKDKLLYCLNSFGSLLWSYKTSGPVFSSPAISMDTVYVGSADNSLYCLTIDGVLCWSYETGGEIFSSPAVGANDTVYAGSADGIIYSINSNGMLEWSYMTGGVIDSSAALSDDKLYIGSNNMFLYALADPTITPTPTDTPTGGNAPTSTPTITMPTSTATPKPQLAIDPGPLTAGQRFTLGVSLTPHSTTPFDFYLFVETPAGMYTIYLNGAVRKGIRPICRNVRSHPATYSKTVSPSVSIPTSMKGKTVTFYAVVVKAGEKPPMRKLPDLSAYVIMFNKDTAIVG